MVTYNRERMRRAVQLLVDSTYAHHHIKRLRTLAASSKGGQFAGANEYLNELLRVGRQCPKALENLISLACSKRDTKNDYQREYMAAKRHREAKVITLETLMTGAPVPEDERKRVLARQVEVWKREKEAFLRGYDDWREKNARNKEFWELKDSELDALIEEAKANGPVRRHTKRVVLVKKTPATVMGQKLQKVLDKR